MIWYTERDRTTGRAQLRQLRPPHVVALTEARLHGAQELHQVGLIRAGFPPGCRRSGAGEHEPDERPDRHEQHRVAQEVVEQALAEDREESATMPAITARSRRERAAATTRSTSDARQRDHERDDRSRRRDPALRRPGQPEVVCMLAGDGGVRVKGSLAAQRDSFRARRQGWDWRGSGARPPRRSRAIVVRADRRDRAGALADDLDLRVRRRERSDERGHDQRPETTTIERPPRLARARRQVEERESAADPGAAGKREHERDERRRRPLRSRAVAARDTPRTRGPSRADCNSGKEPQLVGMVERAGQPAGDHLAAELVLESAFPTRRLRPRGR